MLKNPSELQFREMLVGGENTGFWVGPSVHTALTLVCLAHDKLPVTCKNHQMCAGVSSTSNLHTSPHQTTTSTKQQAHLHHRLARNRSQTHDTSHPQTSSRISQNKTYQQQAPPPSTTQNGSRRSRQHQMGVQPSQSQRAWPAALVLPGVRAADARRERL